MELKSNPVGGLNVKRVVWKPKLDIKLKEKPVEEPDEETEEEKAEKAFSHPVVQHFLRAKAKREKNFAITGVERGKNNSLAKTFYRSVVNKTLDVEFLEKIDEEKYYKQIQSVEFWKEVIDFMFSYANVNTLDFYSQTIRGVFAFYFKHYFRMKASLDARDLDSEEKLMQAIVRKWSKQDAIAVFYLYLTKLYFGLKQDSSQKYNQKYYVYVKFLKTENNIPKIHNVVLENSQVLRGLFLQFSVGFSEWMTKWDLNIDDYFNYYEFSKLCETRGVLLSPEITNRPVDDILYDAITTFTVDFKC